MVNTPFGPRESESERETPQYWCVYPVKESEPHETREERRRDEKLTGQKPGEGQAILSGRDDKEVRDVKEVFLLTPHPFRTSKVGAFGPTSAKERESE